MASDPELPTLTREQLLARLEDLSRADVERSRLLHDLEVHQVELEQQNQALRETQAALEESRDRYADLFDLAPVGYLVLDSVGHILEANLTAAGMLGKERGRLVGRAFSGFLAPPSADLFRGLLRRRGRNARFADPELVLAGAGEPRTVRLECRTPSDQDATDGRWLVALSDVTAQRRAEGLLRLVTDAAPLLIAYVDRGLRYRLVNAGYEQWFGLRREDILGRHLRQVLGRPALEAIRPRLARVLRGETVVYEARLPLRHGGARDVAGTYVPHRGQDGEILGFCAVIRDTTEYKQAEADRLAALERQRDTLVREVHHRIKNHLQGVTGLLRNQILDHPEIAAPLQEAIAQIRTIAQIYGLQSRRDDSRVLLDQLVLAAAGVPAGPVAVECSLPEDGGDEVVLAQEEAVPLALVINELITNALKHLDPPDPRRPVQVSLIPRPHGARIQVRGGPARLPSGFDFAGGRGVGTGLELVRSLLPREGVALAFRQEGDEVVVEVTIGQPVLVP